MKILVTGAAGFVGSNICEKLLLHGHTVIGVDNLKFGTDKNFLSFKNYFPNWTFFQFDFNECFQKKPNIDVVIHAATDNIIYAMNHRSEVISNNAAETIAFFDRIKVPIIYLSTASVYGNALEIPTSETATLQPTEIYSETKLLVEDFLTMRGNYTTLRLSNVYGPNQWPQSAYCGVISKMLHMILCGDKPVVFGDGNQTRDFTYVEDVADAVMLTLLKGPLNTEINIATGVETSINYIMKKFTLRSKRLIDFDFGIEYIGPRPIDNINRRCLDISKARKLLVWEPKHNLESGLTKTVTWLKENHTYEKAN